MALLNAPDFSDRKTIINPYPAFAWLREHHPVYWSEHHKAWLLTRYADVSFAQADARSYSSNRMRQLVDAQLSPEKRAALEPFVEKASRWMYSQDGKEHEAGRKVLGKTFSPGSIEALGDAIQKIIDDQLKQLSPRPEMMDELFNKIPALILAHLFDIPANDALKIRGWTDAIIVCMVGSTDPAYGPKEALQAMEEMYAYFSRLIGRRRLAPGNDLVSQVIAAGDNASMSEEDVLAQLAFVLVAATTTSADQLGIILFYLLEKPKRWAAIRDDPDKVDAAIEEALRICPAGQLSHRVLTEDVVLHGKTMRKGELVFLIRAAANRDPAHFAHPDRFDLYRQKQDHLAFGRGLHYCMGRLLFKLEAQILFTTLLRRFPHMHLVKGRPPRWRDNSLQFRGLSRIEVELAPLTDVITRCFSAAPWEKKGGYCRALRVGNLIMTSGTVSFDAQGKPFAEHDAYLQTQRCLEIIETALKQLGTDRTRVIATRMYTTDMKLWQKILKAHKAFFDGCEPTTMLLSVKALIAPEFLIEIEAQAMVAES